MKILSYPELKTEKGIPYSRQWLRHLIRQKKFPRPVQIGLARVGFVEDEIDRFLENLAAGRGKCADNQQTNINEIRREDA